MKRFMSKYWVEVLCVCVVVFMIGFMIRDTKRQWEAVDVTKKQTLGRFHIETDNPEEEAGGEPMEPPSVEHLYLILNENGKNVLKFTEDHEVFYKGERITMEELNEILKWGYVAFGKKRGEGR